MKKKFEDTKVGQQLAKLIQSGQLGEVDLGQEVFCDICSAVWTGRPDSGGFLLLSKAVCPDCAPRMLERLKANHEDQYIRGWCPKGMSYAAWCLQLRGGNNTVKVIQ